MKRTIKCKPILDGCIKKETLKEFLSEYKNTAEKYLEKIIKLKPLQNSKKYLMVLLEKERVETKLGSAHRQSARDKAIEIYKSWRKRKGRKPKLKNISARFDSRTYRILTTKNKIAKYFLSIRLVKTRKYLPIRMADYQEKMLEEWNIKSAELICRNKNYFVKNHPINWVL